MTKKLMADVDVECDDHTNLQCHRVCVSIWEENDWFEVNVTEVFLDRSISDSEEGHPYKEKTVLTLRLILDEAVKLAGRLAKNAGIDESAMTQALSQAFVEAVKADWEDPSDPEETDSPCQES